MNTSVSFATPEQLASLGKPDQRPAVLDVSTPAEYQARHIEGATPVPLGGLDPRTLPALIGRPGAGRYETLYLTCHDGVRARQLADRLLKAGYHNLVVLDGGNQAWEEAGLPMVRSAPVQRLALQVPIAVGTLLLIAVVLGFTIHELFYVAVPLVAAGLILDGVTRWHGIARLLALMPWNRSRRGPQRSLA